MAKQFHCELIALERVYALAFELSRKIRRDGFAPDWIVAVARGGFVPARLLCDFLDRSALASIAVRHYEPGARRQERALLSVPLAADVRGRRVLVVDDVNDSGDSLDVAREHLAERGAAEVRVAVLHEKLHTRAPAEFRAAEIPDARWLIYQWAVVEDAIGFLEQGGALPGAPEQGRDRLASEFGIELGDSVWRKVQALWPARTEPGAG